MVVRLTAVCVLCSSVAFAQSSRDSRALLDDGAGGHVLAEFAGLAHLFGRWVDGGSADVASADMREIRRQTEHADVDVRALALATLHWVRGDEPDTRRLLARALERAGERDAGLRDRRALALGWAGNRLAGHGTLDAAVRAYRRALEVRPDHVRLLLNLANAERAAGQLPQAVATYRRSLALDPAHSLTYVNLGIALAAAGDTAAAIDAWSSAVRVNRVDPLPHVNLGNARLLREQVDDAIASYRAALALEPGLVAVYLNLARADAVAGRVGDARRGVRAALRLDPSDEPALNLEHQLGPLRERTNQER